MNIKVKCCQALSVVSCLNVTDENQSLLEHVEVPEGSRKVRSGEQELVQVSEGHKDLPQHVDHHHLETQLHQEPSLAPPQSIEEPADCREVDLVLSPAVADESLVEKSAEHLTHARLTPDGSGVSVGLTSQFEEVLHADHPSFSDDLLVQACVHKTEEDVKALQHKSSKMEMESLYPEYGRRSPSATPPHATLTPTKAPVKCEYGDTGSSRGAESDQAKGNLEVLTP